MPPKPDILSDVPNDIERVLPDHDMVFVAGDTFFMGSQDDEVQDDEKPVHEVALGDFSIGKYPVTQALWKAVMGAGNNPSFFSGDRQPVESVSWFDAAVFCNALSVRCQKGPAISAMLALKILTAKLAGAGNYLARATFFSTQTPPVTACPRRPNGNTPRRADRRAADINMPAATT